MFGDSMNQTLRAPIWFFVLPSGKVSMHLGPHIPLDRLPHVRPLSENRGLLLVRVSGLVQPDQELPPR